MKQPVTATYHCINILPGHIKPVRRRSGLVDIDVRILESRLDKLVQVIHLSQEKFPRRRNC